MCRLPIETHATSTFSRGLLMLEDGVVHRVHGEAVIQFEGGRQRSFERCSFGPYTNDRASRFTTIWGR